MTILVADMFTWRMTYSNNTGLHGLWLLLFLLNLLTYNMISISNFKYVYLAYD